ncbi:hypothetical protein D7X55_27730 [Corallococcus sp. AB049A]|uniref:hypothetical protein n=1 Tax=Corallococcus sp. AB049A TaxID=2316721 RepID=UPI000EE06ADD|nr:hypothetical protein [Corallococcus sp. AB049A]RKI57494.1 hypothetical protein D7X55_27730 [Corallococcus sp. AB049A]
MAGELASLAQAFFAATPELSLQALGSGVHVPSLDLAPYGVPVTHLLAEHNAELARQYLTLNQLAFGGIGVPRWVLSDLYLMPGAIGLLRCPARLLKAPARERLLLADEESAIGAACYVAPSLTPGLFVGVSLFSFLPGRGASAWVKLLTLRMVRAKRLRGVTQWDNPAVRVHSRLGPMRLVGRVPGGHDYDERTFVYETDLSNEARVARSMVRGDAPAAPAVRIPVTDLLSLGTLLDRAERGARLELVPPGQDDGHVLVRELPEG